MPSCGSSVISRLTKRMRQFNAIAANAFMELIRQPIFLLLTTLSSLFIVFLAAVPYFAMGEDGKMVKDSALAVMLMIGLFVAVLSASSSVANVRSGPAERISICVPLTW